MQAAAGRSTSSCVEAMSRVLDAGEIGLPHLGRADLQLAPAEVDPAGDQDDPVDLDEAGHGLVDRRERDHLVAAGQTLQPELRVRLAALREPPL